MGKSGGRRAAPSGPNPTAPPGPPSQAARASASLTPEQLADLRAGLRVIELFLGSRESSLIASTNARPGLIALAAVLRGVIDP